MTFQSQTIHESRATSKDDLVILFDFSILAAISERPRQVYSYSYVPAMFVLTFSGEPAFKPSKFTLMLRNSREEWIGMQHSGWRHRKIGGVHLAV
jgi:hypothetical protein